MIVKLLTEHHLECLSSIGGCRGSSESTLVKMSHCWKSHALALIIVIALIFYIIVIDECGEAPCQSGGTCFNTPNSYYCECLNNGWSGKHCDDSMYIHVDLSQGQNSQHKFSA